MNNAFDQFSSFTESFCRFDETKNYAQFEKTMLAFDANSIELKVIDDVDSIIAELNKISRKMFIYGMVLESQNRVLQQLEDEFDLWNAQKQIELKGTTFKSEASKDKFVKAAFSDEYSAFTSKINTEKYKLGILKRTVDAIDMFSFKLHSILSYKQKILDKTL